jgi:hypothetical protein
VQVPFTADGLKLALLNAERWVLCCFTPPSNTTWIVVLPCGGMQVPLHLLWYNAAPLLLLLQVC